MVGLADKCMHPTRNEPYMKSHGGGRDNSPEGQQVARILSSPVFNGGPPPIEEPANLFLSFIRERSPTALFASFRMPRIGSISRFHHVVLSVLIEE
jgi:hypothetical protein